MFRTLAYPIQATVLGLLLGIPGVPAPAETPAPLQSHPGAPAITLVYFHPTVTLSVNAPITADYLTVALFGNPLPGGFANLNLPDVTCTITPALPTGLSLSRHNGTVTGTIPFPAPAAVLGTHSYVTTVSTDDFGSFKVPFTLTVKDLPPTLSYPPIAATVGVPILPDNPTLAGGAVLSYGATLPAGLAVAANGSIMGTPSAPANPAILGVATAYPVSATNSGGTAHATVTITLIAVAPPVISYPNPTVTQLMGIILPPQTPFSTGGPAASYTATGTALAAGLAIVPGTGVLYGSIANAGTYSVQVTAHNSGGDSQPVTVTYTILPPIAIPTLSINNLGGEYITTGNTGSALVNPAVTGVTYLWTISNGTIIGSATGPVITFSAGPASPLPAKLTVSCLATQGSLNSPGLGTASLTVVAKPNAQIFAQPVMPPNSVVGSQVSMPLGNPAWSYTWSVAGAGNPYLLGVNGPSNVVYSGGQGTIQITGKASNAAGDSDTQTTSVQVLQNAFTNPGDVVTHWGWASATALDNGWVLLAGGVDPSTGQGSTRATLYDPVSNTYKPATPMASARVGHTATLLGNGQVLVVGGWTLAPMAFSLVTSAELYDPLTNTWTAAGTQPPQVGYHTATRLADPHQRVLVLGESGGINQFALYDPVSNAWTAATNLPAGGPLDLHTASLLGNGQVLVAGGANGAGTASLNTTWLYTPSSVPGGDAWLQVGNLGTARQGHSATVMADGSVLVTGGADGAGGFLASGECFSLSSSQWVAAGTLQTPRAKFGATLLATGKILVEGGLNGSGDVSGAELFDGTTDTSLPPLGTARSGHGATLLANGKVLVSAGGANASLPYPGAGLNNGEVYDPAAQTWTPAGTSAIARSGHTATALLDGSVLVAGGSNQSSFLSSAQIYSTLLPQTPWDTVASPGVASLNSPRSFHSATRLDDPAGSVLVTGGITSYSPYTPLGSSEIYDPGSHTWTTTASSLAIPRSLHTATLVSALNSSQQSFVLLAGGVDINLLPIGESEKFTQAPGNPAAGTWTQVSAPMQVARVRHTATPLMAANGTAATGEVLVVGGLATNGSALNSLEYYDSGFLAGHTAGQWNLWPTAAAPLTLITARHDHTATLLPDGRILVVGGENFAQGLVFATAELIDPVAQTVVPAGALAADRYDHTATLMPDGTVVVIGGRGDFGQILDSAERFNPQTLTWTSYADVSQFPFATLESGRSGHTATLLGDGSVLVYGGDPVQANPEFWQ